MFSYVIMNPPYNDVNGTMLHYKFLCKALEVAETVVSIQPATWMNQQKNRAGLPLNGRGATINIIQDAEHLFQGGARMKTDLTVSCFSNKYNDIRVDWGNGERTVYPDMASVNTLDRHSMLKNIIDKGYNVFGKDVLKNHLYGNSGGQGSTKDRIIRDGSVLTGKWIVQLMPLIYIQPDIQNKYGVLTYGKKTVVFQHDGSPENLVGRCYCIFNTEQEAENCRMYLSSDLVRAYVLAFKTTANLADSAPHIPWPATFDTDPALWTNEAISDRAGLDQKEREWLAEMLPDCYHVRKTKPAVPHGAAG